MVTQTPDTTGMKNSQRSYMIIIIIKITQSSQEEKDFIFSGVYYTTRTQSQKERKRKAGKLLDFVREQKKYCGPWKWRWN